MNLKRIRKILTTAILAIGLVSGTMTAASASTGGGTGGGGSTGQQSGFYWASVSSSNVGTAYDQFLSRSGWSRSFAEAEAGRRVGNVSICQNSDVIWFLMGPQVWAYNYQGYPTWLSHWNIRGTIQSPQSLYGPTPSPTQYQNFIDWDNGVGGMRRDNPGINGSYGYTIICSYATYRPPLTRYSSSTNVTSDTKNESFTKPYSWSTEITRQPLTGDGGEDPIGANNLHNQSVDQKTNFGNFWDSVNTSAPMTPQQLTNGVNTALNADATSAHGVAALDADNKAGMAEGGILNVKEQTKYATVSTSETTRVTTVTNCTHTSTWNSYWGGYNAENTSCSDSSSTSITRSSSKVAGTLQNTGFWQMLAVHCNQAEFEALLNSDSSLTQITTPDPTNSLSGVVHTKNYINQPADLDFGDSTNPSPAKAKTANLAFFDKECPFDCKPSGNVASPGASSGSVSSNALEFFRDNAPKKVTVDTWIPETGNGVAHNGSPALTTTVTRDVTGTPGLSGTNGGKFTMTTDDGEKILFTGSTTTAPTQKNWDKSTFSGPMATILNGQHNSFNLQASWASDAGKPQAFNFKWEYAPTVTTTVPVSGIGFGPASAQAVGTAGNVSTMIEGKCYAFFGTPIVSNSIAEFGANTGTGTVNNLDKGLLTGSNATVAKLTANFVRSTTE